MDSGDQPTSVSWGTAVENHLTSLLIDLQGAFISDIMGTRIIIGGFLDSGDTESAGTWPGPGSESAYFDPGSDDTPVSYTPA